jgi:hypothetical protein
MDIMLEEMVREWRVICCWLQAWRLAIGDWRLRCTNFMIGNSIILKTYVAEG